MLWPVGSLPALFQMERVSISAGARAKGDVAAGDALLTAVEANPSLHRAHPRSGASSGAVSDKTGLISCSQPSGRGPRR